MICRFSPTGRRRVKRSHLPSPESATPQSSVPSSARLEASADLQVAPLTESSRTSGESDLTHPGDVSAEEEADVPREARLLCDARGKLSTKTP